MEAVMKTCTGASSEAVNRISSLSGEEQSDSENISNIREKFLFPILTDLAIVSVECAVLEAKIKYKQLYPLWNGIDPIPIAFAADGRWPKPRSWGGSSTSSPLVIMDSDRESGEEDETEKDYVTTDAHGKIIWNDSSDDEEDQMVVDGEGGEAGGAGGEDVVFELELLQYCEDKPSRELGVDEMPQKSGRPRRTIKLNRYDAYTY